MIIKIAVLNNSGNVGKSTICKNLLQPRIPNSEIIKVETINSDGTTDEALSAHQFLKITEKIDNTDAAIIDIGSSNIELFTSKMKKFEGSVEDIDFYIVPIVPSDKQQADSITTIRQLLDMGADKSSIRVIFNFADETLPIEDQYERFFSSSLTKPFTKNKVYSVIPESEVFSLLSSRKQRLIDVLADDRDFKALIRAAENKEERGKLSMDRAIKRLALGVNRHFDTAFDSLKLIKKIETA